MADDLGALGEIITDRTLILNVIRGLNDRFSHVGALLRHRRPFPTSPAPAPRGGGVGGNRGKSANRRSKRGTSRNNGGGGGDAAGGQRALAQPQSQPGTTSGAKTTPAGASWPTFCNPWTETIQCGRALSRDRLRCSSNNSNSRLSLRSSTTPSSLSSSCLPLPLLHHLKGLASRRHPSCTTPWAASLPGISNPSRLHLARRL